MRFGYCKQRHPFWNKVAVTTLKKISLPCMDVSSFSETSVMHTAVNMEVSPPPATSGSSEDGSTKKDDWEANDNSTDSSSSDQNNLIAEENFSDKDAKLQQMNGTIDNTKQAVPTVTSSNQGENLPGIVLPLVAPQSTSPSQMSADSGVVSMASQAGSPSCSSSPSINSMTGKEGVPTSSNDTKTQSRNLNLIACEECGLICAGQSHYQVHIRSHTGERPFKCTECGVAFTQKGNLRRHYKIHSEEKPFQCPVCSYRCRRRDALNGHMRIHSDIRPYRCVYCARSYKSRQSLKEHEYQCPYKNDPVARGSPSKLTVAEQDTAKMSPKRSYTSNMSSAAQKRSLTVAAINPMMQTQQLLNFNANSLVAQSGLSASSSGKRKGSNPQKITRFREVPNSRQDAGSPSSMVSQNSSVSNALQFMPSLITSMMQERMKTEAASVQSSTTPQDEAIDFSAKRISQKNAFNAGRNSASPQEREYGEGPVSYVTKRPRIGGEFVLASSTPLLNGDIKRDQFTPVDHDSIQSGESDKDHSFEPSEQGYMAQPNEKLMGSAKRKRPRYLNERVTSSPSPTSSKQAGMLNDNDSLRINSIKSSPDSSLAAYATQLAKFNSLAKADDTSSIESPGQATLDLTGDRTKVPRHGDESVKRGETRTSPTPGAKFGDAAKYGLRVFSTAEGEGENEIEELKAFICTHCRCIFLDHVMFAIHAGCHGFRDPLECNVCGHQASDRYQFQSHLTRGEHLVVLTRDAESDSANGVKHEEYERDQRKTTYLAVTQDLTSLSSSRGRRTTGSPFLQGSFCNKTSVR
ncbi:ikaros family zinc finger protein-like isoform X2 [Clavelina lepadiformis]|uniref:ikaros family zinc finger protein-like isoform X2 n=1 Tax=Clavelina lepadiformis TaxID=159417 RepID=UPI004042C945